MHDHTHRAPHGVGFRTSTQPTTKGIFKYGRMGIQPDVIGLIFPIGLNPDDIIRGIKLESNRWLWMARDEGVHPGHRAFRAFVLSNRTKLIA